MIYFIFTVGFIIFLYGFIKSRAINRDFKAFFNDASEKEEIKLVNHTLKEETLKEEISSLQLEIEKLKQRLKDEALFQRLKDSDDDRSFEELCKEMKIGKGELLLLKNLSKR